MESKQLNRQKINHNIYIYNSYVCTSYGSYVTYHTSEIKVTS